MKKTTQTKPSTKLQRIVDDLMGQIKVRALEAQCSPIRLLQKLLLLILHYVVEH
jgi:hypothetical protein